MFVDRAWAVRNLGFDSISRSRPASTFALPPAEASARDVDLQREIIDFDSKCASSKGFPRVKSGPFAGPFL